MLTAEARVETDRPHRYLTQLREHIGRLAEHRGHRPGMHTPPEIQHTEWTDDHGVVTLALGQWTIHATPGALTLHLEATDETKLRELQALVAGRIEKIGRRDRLTVTWSGDTPSPKPRFGRWLLAAVVVVAVVAHVVLGSAALAISGWAAAGLVVLVLGKLAVVRLIATRHGKSHAKGHRPPRVRR